jgi:hypothetical protein
VRQHPWRANRVSLALAKRHHCFCRDCEWQQPHHYKKACLACGSVNLAEAPGSCPRGWERGPDTDELVLIEVRLDQGRTIPMAEVKERLLWERGVGQ